MCPLCELMRRASGLLALIDSKSMFFKILGLCMSSIKLKLEVQHWISDLVIGFLMIIFCFGYLDVKRSREHFEVALGLCLLCSYFDRTTNL